MELTGVDFFWDNVVIGADLDAVQFSHANHYHLIKNRAPHHHSYEGIEDEWAKKLYQLYEMALVPFTDQPNSLRILPEQKIIKIFTDQNTYTVGYNHLHLFDDTNVEGLSLNRELICHRVIDWFDCQGIYDLDFHSVTTADEFVGKILLFTSKRIDGNQKYLDLLCESFLDDNQLKNFEYSDTMARFKVTKILKDRGVHKPELRFWKRDVYPVYKTI